MFKKWKPSKSKKRIIEIYNDLNDGYILDGRGYRK